VLLFNEYQWHEYKQQGKPSSYRQKPAVALRELRRLASDRGGWALLARGVCDTNRKKERREIET